MLSEQSKEYLQRKIQSQYPDHAQKIREGWQTKRHASLRVNTLKSTAEKVADELTKKGIEFEQMPWYKDAFLLRNTDEKEIFSLPICQNGEVYLQSLSSMLPPLILNVQKGNTVLDMAAAPGGKTLQMVALSENKAQITACERHPARAEKLRFNLQKQGANRVSVLTQDATTLSDFFRFDKILLDTPCSGSGTVDWNDPYSKAVFSDEHLKKLQKTQTALLKKAVTLLKQGESMVYSTCSLFREENEEIVQTALKGLSSELLPIDKTPFGNACFLPTTLDGVLCVCPDENFEGFFVAHILKK